MSRGNDTTVTRRGSSLMWTSIVTSLRSPPSSSSPQRGNNARSCPSQESVPAISMFTPPSISPIVGGSCARSSPSSATLLSETVRAASHTAKAPTAAPLTATTATATPSTAISCTNGFGERSSPCRATGRRRRDAFASERALTDVLST
ncbi:MAG: hypothetical protein PGN24_09970 [Microbacterium arborescens]